MEKLYNFFNDCAWARESEKPTKGFLENCTTLWNKFSTCDAVKVVREAEVLFGADSPFTSVLQMYHLTLCGGKPSGSKLLWVFESVLDMKRAGCLKNEEVSKSKLMDGGNSPADLYAFKYDLLLEFLGPSFLNTLGFSAAVCTEFNKVLGNHRSFRRAFGYRNNERAFFTEMPTHEEWRAKLNPSEELAL